MPVLERNELEASPLADLHAIANQIGLDGFRRLRKADLIDAILGGEPEAQDGEAEEERPRRRRSTRGRRSRPAAGEDAAASEPDEEDGAQPEADEDKPARSRRASETTRRRGGRTAKADRDGKDKDTRDKDEEEPARSAEGVVEVLGNGSAFLRVDPPEPSDEDVYISAAQVRRCELVSGDRVSGPVRTPRRSERYPSLVRIDTINGDSAESVADGVRYDELPVAWPSERLSFDSKDATLEAIEVLTPLGLGSRAVIVGPRLAGKSETLRKLAAVLHGREGIELSLVLVGIRPEELEAWHEGPVEPAASLTFAASADAQGQAIERVLDAAKRLAARGSNSIVLIDGLDGLAAQTARRVLAAARNLREAGSLTVIATATKPLGGETTVIALDPRLAAARREPILELGSSGTLRPELLVGDKDAAAIARARADALDADS